MNASCLSPLIPKRLSQRILIIQNYFKLKNAFKKNLKLNSMTTKIAIFFHNKT